MLGDGKSTIVSNLAIIMAQSGQRVILIDADLRRPRLHAIFALKNRPGLSRMFVQQDVPLSEALQATEVPGLSVLTAGYLPPNPLELVGSDRMNMILHQAQEQADIVLIDAPPVSAVSDAAVLAKRMDGVLLVISVGKTQIDASQETLDQLNRAGTKIIGVVLNDKKARKSRYYYY
jgi:capsular exopolysaccharide synthesis family protein